MNAAKLRMKNIWIINQYATTPVVSGDGHRHYYLGKEFEEYNYKTTIITSAFNHFKKEKIRFRGVCKTIKSDVDVVLLASNSYKKTEGIGRIISMFVFVFILFLAPKRKWPKPDVIIVSSISLLPILYGVWYKLWHPKCKFVLEIRDIWPLTLIQVGGYNERNIFIRFLAWVERLGYKKADYITSLMGGADQHIKNVLQSEDFKFRWVSNGYFLGESKEQQPLNKKILDKLPSNKFLVGYAGALGNANAMEHVIKAFNDLDREDVVLCIIGKGDKKDKLKDDVTNENVIFFDSIPKNQVQGFLNEMNLLYLSWKKIPLYKFGVSANKIFDYMYSGKPVLMSGNMNNDPISLSKGGLVVEPEDANAIINGILEMYRLTDDERRVIGENGKNYLLNNFTYSILAKAYVDVFNELSS